MTDRAIALLACYVPEAPPTSPPIIPTYITRCEKFYPNHRRASRERAEGFAERLYTQARNWYHPTDMFSSSLAGSRFAGFRLEWQEMATSKRTATVPSSDRPEWQGFLERRLTEDELQTLDDWKPKPAELFELLHRLMEDGYDVSLSYSKKTSQSTCTLKDVQHGRKTAGYALSSHDENGAAALKMAIFKHFSCLDTKWDGLLGEKPKARRG